MKIFIGVLIIVVLPVLASASISVSFPAERQQLPSVTNTYVIGAVDLPATNRILTINGATTEVFRTGAFLAMAPVVPGTNTLTLTWGDETFTRKFNVAAPAKHAPAAPFASIANATDSRLAPFAAWQATGALFANRVRTAPDGDTAFFLPQKHIFRGAAISGHPKWITAWFNNQCYYIPRSCAKPLPDAALPAADAAPPDITEGFPETPPAHKTPPQITVCIDPGHGGSDTGALSPHGWTEKEINLLQALALRKVLQDAGFNVIMTRDSDIFPALYARPELAFASKADLFISIHHNSTPAHRNPREARHTCTYASTPQGLALARKIQKHLATALWPIPDGGAREQSFAVCRNPAVPSCLVEVDFINLPEGEAESWNQQRLQSVSRAILHGILDWLYNNRNPEN